MRWRVELEERDGTRREVGVFPSEKKARAAIAALLGRSNLAGLVPVYTAFMGMQGWYDRRTGFEVYLVDTKVKADVPAETNPPWARG